MSFELAAPTQLSSCLGEVWEGANAHEELLIVGISGIFDQKLVILFFGEVCIYYYGKILYISSDRADYYLRIIINLLVEAII